MRYFILLIAIALSGCASRPPAITIDAKVVKSNYYTKCKRVAPSTLERIAGGGIGYAAGKQFGKGNGNKTMKVIGTGVGLALTEALVSSEECKSGYYSVIEFKHPKTGLVDFAEIPTKGRFLSEGFPVKYTKRF